MALLGNVVVRRSGEPDVYRNRGSPRTLFLRTSLCRRLDSDIREPLLDAIAERTRTRMGDRASRRYLSVLRVGQRDQNDNPTPTDRGD
jgi:hypothetical protein